MRRKLCTTLLVVASLAQGLARPSEAMTHPNLARGYSADRSFQPGLIDNVNLFNGGLNLAIPIGQAYPVSEALSYGLTLTYSSSVWDFTDYGAGGVDATASSLWNAGLGWRLSMGEVYEPSGTPANPSEWMYVGPDGASHIFYDALHRDEDDGSGASNETFRYTRDGSYLRMSTMYNGSPHWMKIEFPNGLAHVFSNDTDDVPWQVEWIEDRHGNKVTLEDANPLQWVITDSVSNRVHYINFESMVNLGKTVTSIDLEGFGGARAIYTLTHDDQHRWESCKDTYDRQRREFPLLASVELPDGSTYDQMEYVDVDQGACQTDMIEKVRLPTKGSIEWAYQDVHFPDQGKGWRDGAQGVHTRSLIRADGSEEGTTTYTSVYIDDNDPNDGEDLREVRTHVIAPTGECSRHFFATPKTLSKAPHRGWEYGLPFSWQFTSTKRGETLYRSVDVFEDNNGTLCAGDRVQSTYLRFEHDKLPAGTGEGDKDLWYATNRRVSAMRTTYPSSDPGFYTQEIRRDFDGLGHYRTVTASGNHMSLVEEDVVVTNYNRSQGTYTINENNGQSGGYVVLPYDEPWVLDIFDSVEAYSDSASGETRSRREFNFDTDAGVLLADRTLAAGVGEAGDTGPIPRSDHDILTYYEYDDGNVVTVERFGGDLVAIDDGSGWLKPSHAPGYREVRTYEFGAFATAKMDGVSFFSRDYGIDESTGMAERVSDSAGIEVFLTYDVMGRIEKSKPEAGHGAVSKYLYFSATDSSPAETIIREKSNDSTTKLTERRVVFNDFGVPIQRRELLPGDTWIEQAITYDAAGRPESASAWGNTPGPETTIERDALGRVVAVTPPEGASHAVTLNYIGDRIVERTASIATSASGESWVTTTRRYDHRQRLRRVTEPSSSTENTSSYSYDVVGRLRTIHSKDSGTEDLQYRIFEYDNRGFKTGERHVELGFSPVGGWVYYSNFDSLGNAGASKLKSESNPLRHLEYTFDAAGRLVDVSDALEGGRPVFEFSYDENVSGLGKMTSATRHNYLDLPWSVLGEEDIPVVEAYSYDGVNGAVSAKSTAIGLHDYTFEQSFVHDALGNLISQSYPSCTAANCDGSNGRVQNYVFSRGLAASVPGWIDSFGYESNGALSTIAHTNGVTEQILQDLLQLQRPREIKISNADTGSVVSLGEYQYDGSGNIKAVGDWVYVYDEVARLVEADHPIYNQSYAYDAFGNMNWLETDLGTGPSTRTFDVDSERNRFSLAEYDYAGNFLGMVTGDGSSYSYDTQNQIKRQEFPDPYDMESLYVYSPGNERVLAVHWAGSEGTEI